MLMELHMQSKKEVNMGKLSYRQQLKYLEPLPMSYPLLPRDFLKPEGWKNPKKWWVLLYAYMGGEGGQKEREALSTKECRSVHKRPDQRQFVLSLNFSTYLFMYLFTSQTLWGKSYGWCADVHCILNSCRVRISVIFSENVFLSQQNPTVKECSCNC